MNLKTGLGFSSSVAGAVCLGILAIAVPTHLWTSDGLVSALVLSLSVASPAWLTIPALRREAAEATRIWLIGPVGRLWLLLSLVAGTALRASFFGWHRASWAVCVLWGGLCLVGVFILSASTQIVDAASSQTRIARADARSRWTQLLLAVRPQVANDDVRKLIERLADKIRFAANEPTAQEPEENQKIDMLLAAD